MILYVRTSLRYYDMTSVRSMWHTTIMEQRIIWSHVDLGSWHSSFIWVMWKKVSQEIIHWYWSLINWLRYFMIIRISDIVYTVINSVFIHSFMYSLICSLSGSFTHTLIYSLTHSLTHPLPLTLLTLTRHRRWDQLSHTRHCSEAKERESTLMAQYTWRRPHWNRFTYNARGKYISSHLILSYLLHTCWMILFYLYPFSILFFLYLCLWSPSIPHFTFSFSLIFFIYFSLIFFRPNQFSRERNLPLIAGSIYTILLNQIYGVARGLLTNCEGVKNVKNNRTSFLYVFSAICTDMIWVVWGTLCESAFSTMVASDIKIWCTDSGSRVCGLDCSAPCVVDRILHIKL